MAIYRIQTSLQSDSGLPRDQFVNSIHVDYDGVLPGIYDGWCAAVAGMYQALQPYLSPVIAQNGHTSKVYLVGAPLESPPVFTSTWNFTTAPGGTALPNEVASCISFHGVRNTLWERQSTYGRIYLGPLNTSAGATVTGGGSIPAAAFRTEAVTRAAQMAEALATDDADWVVYSKLHNLGTPVTEVSMDDEWDTVRSRGYRATTKTILPVA